LPIILKDRTRKKKKCYKRLVYIEWTCSY